MSLDARSRELVNQAQAYDLAESQRLRRAALAQEAGLPPGEFARPFPGTSLTYTVNQAPRQSRLGTAGALLSAILGLAGLGAGGYALLKPPAIPPVVPATSPAQTFSGQDYEIRWHIENGTMITDPPRRISP